MLAAAPALAQDNAATAPPAPPATENIGPRELSNFSINGTVTRPAEEQPASQPPAAAGRDPAARVAAPAGDDRPAASRSGSAEPARTVRPERPTSIALSPPTVAGPTARAPRPAAPAPAPEAALPPLESPSGFSPLPWIAALLLLGAGAFIYFGMHRRNERYAHPGGVDFFDATPAAEPGVRPAPRPAPRPTAQPAPAPPIQRPAPRRAPAPVDPVGTITSSLRTHDAPATPPGLVTSSLRPWIELELEPSQAVVTDEHAAIAFDVTLFNSGSAPARDVAVEACLINAGEQQDVQLSQFFGTAADVRDKIPAVAPMARITLKSAVRLPRAAVQEYEVEGRRLFVPMVAVNSRYRWSSGEGQSAAGFLVGGAANDSERLAPLRLDQGKRDWKGLAARRYEKGIRR